MRKANVAFLIAFFLFWFGAIFGQSQKDQSHKKFKLGLEVRWLRFDFESSGIEVENIPPFMRQVPVHKSDGYLGLAGKTVTVPADKINPGLFTSYSPALAPEITFNNRLQIRAGPTINIPLSPKPIRDNKGSTREIHQYDSGTSRGYGTSLVFYAVSASPRPHFGWLGEIELIVNKNFSFLGGYAESNENLQIRTGWDRYNALQTYKKYPLGTRETVKKYVGLRAGPSNPEEAGGNVLITAGIASYGFKTNPLAQGAKVTVTAHSPFIALTISFTFGS